MKILSFSDLHLDFNNERLKRSIIPDIANFIKEKSPDRIIVAGDMAGGSKACIEYVEKIEDKTGIPISYVAGNHSIWIKNKKKDSWVEYNNLKEHHSSLMEAPLELNNEWVLLGGMGWYDYSFGEKSMNREQIAEHKKYFWNDNEYAKWGMSDEELCEMMLIKFRTQLEQYKDKNIVFVNHFIPYPHFVTYKPNDMGWNACNVFMGSSKLGDLLDEYKNVKYVIFGHTHRRYGTVEFGDKNIVCNPFGYVGEWGSKDVLREIHDAATLIVLP